MVGRLIPDDLDTPFWKKKETQKIYFCAVIKQLYSVPIGWSRCFTLVCRDFEFISLTSTTLALTVVTSRSKVQPVNTDSHGHFRFNALQTPALTLNWPDMMVSVMLRLLSDSPKDWRDEDEEVLEVSDGGRAVLTGVAVGVALPLDLRRSFSAFRISISFWSLRKERRFDKISQRVNSNRVTGCSHSDRPPLLFRISIVGIMGSKQLFWSSRLSLYWRLSLR